MVNSMSKKKHKNKNPKVDDPLMDEKYRMVLSALAFVFETEKEEENRRQAKEKVRRVLNWFTVIGAVIVVALSFINNYLFDISWAKDIKKWYSDIYISFMVYIFVTDVVLILEKRFKMDQKPLFGYLWPFIAFSISLFLTNTIRVEIRTGELRANIALFCIYLLPSILLMRETYKTGKARGEQKANLMRKAEQMINDNPDTVKQVLNDYDNYLKTKNDIDQN